MSVLSGNSTVEYSSPKSYAIAQQVDSEHLLTVEQLQKKIYREMSVRMKKEDKQIGLWCLDIRQDSCESLPLWQHSIGVERMTTAQQLLADHAEIREAFHLWCVSKQFKGSPTRIIESLMPLTWQQFCESPQAKALAVNLREYPVARPGSVSAVVAVQKPVESLPSVQNGVQPIIPAVPIPEQPMVATVDSQPAQAPKIGIAPEATESVLFSAIVQGLRQVGFAPENAVTAEQCRTIAENAAIDIFKLAQEQGMVSSKQVIEIQQPDQTVKTVHGKAPSWFPRLVKLAQCRIPALLVGPAGSGKTTAAKLLAECLDLPYTRVSLSAGVDEGVIQGWLLPVGEQGRFDYVPSACTYAYEHGGVVLFDELDAADPNMLIILSACLDNGEWHIPLRHNAPKMVRHENFIAVAAANTFGHGADRRFVGANRLDERTLARFRNGQITCDYDAALEKDLFSADVVRIGHILRHRCRAIPGGQRDIATRDLEAWHIKRQQFSLAECLFEYFADWMPDELQRVHVSLDHVLMTATVE